MWVKYCKGVDPACRWYSTNVYFTNNWGPLKPAAGKQTYNTSNMDRGYCADLSVSGMIQCCRVEAGQMMSGPAENKHAQFAFH